MAGRIRGVVFRLRFCDRVLPLMLQKSCKPVDTWNLPSFVESYMQQVVQDLWTINASSTRAYFCFVLFERTIFFWKMGEVKKTCFRHISWSRQALFFFFCQVWSPNPTENAIEISHAFRDSWLNAWQWHLFLFLFGVPANWNMFDIWLVYLCCSGFKKSDEKLATVGYMGTKIPHPQYPTPGKQAL